MIFQLIVLGYSLFVLWYLITTTMIQLHNRWMVSVGAPENQLTWKHIFGFREIGDYRGYEKTSTKEEPK